MICIYTLSPVLLEPATSRLAEAATSEGTHVSCTSLYFCILGIQTAQIGKMCLLEAPNL